MKDFFTTREVASLFGKSDYTIRRWIAEGIISAIKVGGRLLVPGSEIQKLIDSAQMGRKE